MMPYVTFDFIPQEWSTDLVFDFDENGKPFNDGLEELGYSTSKFLLNIGSLFIFLGILCLKYFIYYCLYAFNAASKNKY